MAPDTAYEVSVKVGSGTGAVVVTWVSSSRAGLVREDTSPVVEGGPSWPGTSVVLTAPAHATAARIGLSAFGGRPALFDDVVFRRSEAAGLPELKSGDLRVRLDATGAVEAVRGGEVLLTEGGLAPSVDAGPEALLGASLDAPPVFGGAALEAHGKLYGGSGFDTRVEAAAGGASLRCTPKAGGSGAFTFTCPAGLARGAVTLVLANTVRVVPEDETFSLEGVRKIIVGTLEGGQPFVLSADGKSPGFAFSSRRTGRGLRVQLAPPSPAPEGADGASVLLTVDLAQEEHTAQELLKSARDHKTAGRLGKAVDAFDRVTLAFHYLGGLRDEAARERDALLKTVGDRLATAKARALGDRKFGSIPGLRWVIAECGELKRDFGSHRIGEEAGKLEETARAALDAATAEAAADNVERLFQRYMDCREANYVALQVALGEEIARVAPPSNEYRVRVEGDLPRLREELRKQQADLYGTRR